MDISWRGKNGGYRISWPLLYDSIAGRQLRHYDTIAVDKTLGGNSIVVHRESIWMNCVNL